MTSFSQQVKAFRDKVETRATHVVQSTVMMLGERILETSAIGQWDLWTTKSKKRKPRPPYVPGQFIGSWYYSYDVPRDEAIATIDESGDSSRYRFSEIYNNPAFGKHYLQNSLEYAMSLEHGYAIDPAKAHMVDYAKLEFHSIVKNIVEKENI